MPNPPHQQKVEITGTVFQIDTERRKFKLRTPDGQAISAPFTNENQHRVIAVLQDPENKLIKVSGLAEFTPNGALKRVVKAENIIIALPEREIDPNAPTITEMIDALIASYPDDFWANMPTDLAQRHIAFHSSDTDLSQ